MRKNVLALSIATMIGGLGFAGIASADVIRGAGGADQLSASNATDFTLAEAGTGHILVVPYFSAQGGNMSVFHVVNTDLVNGKAVKVRFRGASNSDDILDFQVFMSPGDVWTAAVSQGSNGAAQIVTSDTTCTVPKLNVGIPQTFDAVRRINPGLTGDAKNAETREGYVEMFNMADVPPNYLAFTGFADSGKTNKLYATIKHPSSGAAPTCDSAILESSATFGNLTNLSTDEAAIKAGYDTPTGTLFADWYIINVPQTTTFSGSATAVQATVGGALGRGNFVHFPQIAGTAPTPALFTADPLFRTSFGPSATPASGYGPIDASTTGTATFAPAIQASNYDLPDLSTPYVSAVGVDTAPLEQAGLLTNALTASTVTNQYATAPSISAKTDWVFSMPTRRYSVAYDYTKTGTDGLRFSKLSAAGAIDNQDQWFNPGNVTVGANKQICVEAQGQVFRDREERSQTSGAVFSPGDVSKTTFCGETSVVSFGGSVLGATVATQVLTSGIFVNGWGTVTFKGRGLPVVGAGFTKLSNPDVGSGVSGTYGITWPHRFTR